MCMLRFCACSAIARRFAAGDGGSAIAVLSTKAFKIRCEIPLTSGALERDLLF